MARLGAAKRLPAIASPISPGIVSGLVMRKSSRKTIESGCGSLSFFKGTGILSARFNVVDNAMRGEHCAHLSDVACTGRWKLRLANSQTSAPQCRYVLSPRMQHSNTMELTFYDNPRTLSVENCDKLEF